ncbi:hypothetical protein [Marinobacter alexandrii]|uniref:hypothetical protein n=1 Tax=Marinobacter alexandrii TaxID=2570351 RepID=UPI002ABD6B18|nr:hypothetical protein [Marinobacter alexandrii]
MIKKTALVLLTVLLGACSSVPYNYTPNSTSFSIPEIGSQITAGLGEPLIDQGVSTVRDILKITKDSEIAAYNIEPGKLVKVGEDASAEYYAQDSSSGLSIYSGLISSKPDPSATVKYEKDANEYCIMRPADLTVCGQISALRDTETVVTNENFRRTLIYSGRVGNRLKVSYREFSNNLARAAFNTEVEYDLSESNIIGYAGARLEVLKATNTEIEYKVLSNFNPI